ncbi:hypothetical protein [Ruicaihuangia caeni]|uniref:Uncharacterized protein n=1 Tax=Ruicaihuangia caeni TaxID=3042517 RepID=A0AAW6T7G9_9MICO|nr:hypothetical protein [Klugiella sp. YN-L-19]MDI2099046.1 hypothetical protein [Klugiella sp. YN-L-19]
MRELRVPKRRTPVELVLADGTHRNVLVFLAESAARHSGPERLSDLLDGESEFIPAVDASTDAVFFLSCQSVAVARVDSSVEGDDVGQHTVSTEHEVELTLVGGVKLRGLVAYVMPPDRSRLTDYLNSESRFIKLIEQDAVALINKQQVALVEALESTR